MSDDKVKNNKCGGATDVIPVALEKPKSVDIGTSGKEDPREIGGRDGPDPTRFGDWEKNGRCIDF